MVHVRADKADWTSVPHYEKIAALGAAAAARPVLERRNRDQVTRAGPTPLTGAIDGCDLERTAHAQIVAPPRPASQRQDMSFRRSRATASASNRLTAQSTTQRDHAPAAPVHPPSALATPSNSRPQKASLPLASLTLRIAAHSCTKRCVVYAYTSDLRINDA